MEETPIHFNIKLLKNNRKIKIIETKQIGSTYMEKYTNYILLYNDKKLERSYSDFEKLYYDLINTGKYMVPFISCKYSISNVINSNEFLKKRKSELEIFINKLINNDKIATEKIFIDFLGTNYLSNIDRNIINKTKNISKSIINKISNISQIFISSKNNKQENNFRIIIEKSNQNYFTDLKEISEINIKLDNIKLDYEDKITDIKRLISNMNKNLSRNDKIAKNLEELNTLLDNNNLKVVNFNKSNEYISNTVSKYNELLLSYKNYYNEILNIIYILKLFNDRVDSLKLKLNNDEDNNIIFEREKEDIEFISKFPNNIFPQINETIGFLKIERDNNVKLTINAYKEYMSSEHNLWLSK